MIFNFTGQTDEIREGLEILSKRLGFEISAAGTEVRVTKRPGEPELSLSVLNHFFLSPKKDGVKN